MVAKVNQAILIHHTLISVKAKEMRSLGANLVLTQKIPYKSNIQFMTVYWVTLVNVTMEVAHYHVILNP